MVSAISSSNIDYTTEEEVIRETLLETETGVAYARSIKITYNISAEDEKKMFISEIKEIMEGIKDSLEQIKAKDDGSIPFMKVLAKGVTKITDSIDETVQEANKAPASDIQKINRIFGEIFDEQEEDEESALEAFARAEGQLEDVQNGLFGFKRFENNIYTTTTEPEGITSATVDYKVVYGFEPKN